MCLSVSLHNPLYMLSSQDFLSNQQTFFNRRDEPKDVEPLFPPTGATAGDRILVENYEDGTPDDVLNPKKKIWEKLQVDLKVHPSNVAQWQGNNLFSKSGPVTAKRLSNVPIR